MSELVDRIGAGPTGQGGRYDAILIAGPTASGKSALAISLAQAFNGVVVNADSMQVYRDLRVITARPTLEEEASAPHAMFGHVDGAINYSVGKWVVDAKAELVRIAAAGQTPILTGGTGMYFKALLEGLSDIPPVPDEIREQIRAEGEGVDPAELHARLSLLDPQTAALLRPTDPQRILRALEVFAATGQSLASFQGKRTPGLLDPTRCFGAFLEPNRAALHERINTRFEMMMEQGAVEEVAQLAKRDLDPALPVMRAHGVPALIAWMRGEISREAAIERGQTDTRQYVKRQTTFARHQLPGFVWVAV